MSYSIDLREKALQLVEAGRTKEAVAKLLRIGVASLYRWLKKKRAGESLRAKPRRTFESKVNLQELEAYVKEHVDATLSEIQTTFGWSIGAIWYRLKQMKITLKKSHSVPRTQSRG